MHFFQASSLQHFGGSGVGLGAPGFSKLERLLAASWEIKGQVGGGRKRSHIFSHHKELLGHQQRETAQKNASFS